MNLTPWTSRRRQHRTDCRSRKPRLECLEGRLLLSSVVAFTGVELRITGDPVCIGANQLRTEVLPEPIPRSGHPVVTKNIVPISTPALTPIQLPRRPR